MGGNLSDSGFPQCYNPLAFVLLATDDDIHTCPLLMSGLKITLTGLP
jgi:hypothetical protein